MGSIRGRKPKPREQRIAEGNPGKRPLPAVVVVAGRPELEEMQEAPDHLPVDAQRWWAQNVPRLVELGIIDRIDVTVLEQLATQYARIQQANRVVAQEGHFARGSTGQLVEHPALKIERQATSLFMSLAEQYALTPIARTRLGLAELNRQSLAQELAATLGADDDSDLEDTGEVVDDDDAEEITDAEVIEDGA